jgi:hypothetical protein
MRYITAIDEVPGDFALRIDTCSNGSDRCREKNASEELDSGKLKPTIPENASRL